MSALWYAILAFMLSTYVVLDGRNFGAGILHWIVARDRLERRQIIAAIGPLWSWHEVWLVGTGGVMIMAFPRFMALVFSGYYLALFLVLWCILLRGISLEVGGHIDDDLWQTFWDFVFTVSNALLAVLFGAAFGNVIRGVAMEPDGHFYLTFFTDFRTTGHVGLLDWYTLAVAAFATLVLTAHGATYLTMRTEGPVHDRSRSLAWRLWLAAIPLFLLITGLTWVVRPELLSGLPHRPFAWLNSLIALGGAAALATGLRRGRERLALTGSTMLIYGVIMTGAAALFPVMLYCTLPGAEHLNATALAAPDHSLRIAIFWWVPALCLSLFYLYVIQRYYSGKVNVTKDNQGLY
ncbi:cytochrome d ubiquinol oxidase subunit II [bacterium SCN 62-11]|nr:cytochrome d ubiquinol oxidase subunit II [Candidatus Eremiobacteraeota bacterium]ODT68534.1 MAG: cytochrome d ubiquinol oxidase subunit II [bacterium SCN 62-11]